MTDTPNPKLALATRLSHGGRNPTRSHGFVNPPVHRGSTVLYADMAERRAFMRKRMDQAITYGLHGTPTHFALEDVIADIEGGTRCQIYPSGLAAITGALLAYLGQGDHLLLPDSVYAPTRSFADGMLRRMGIATTYYPPLCTAAELAALITPATRVLFVESPGSHTFEVQDVPALAAAAHEHGVAVLMDNTWGIAAFQPFAHGVDVSIQALTKYAGGHSDILLGSATVSDDSHWQKIRPAALDLGMCASPDDCWLALRGLRSMAVRLERQEASGLAVARFLAGRPEVAQVLHPALPGAPGHALWARDFTGACSLFGVVFQPHYSAEARDRFVDALTLFGIGASWGGFESLALPTNPIITRTAAPVPLAGPTVRLHIGLEAPEDLIADLEQALRVFN